MTFCYLYQVRHSEDLCRVLCAHAPLWRGGVAPSHSPAWGCATPRPLSFGARFARPSRVPRARGLRPRCGGAPPLPLGFVASRAACGGFACFRTVRACALVCASFCLACSFPFGLVAPPRPSSEGGADSRGIFVQNKKPYPFLGKAFADTLPNKISFSA